MELMLLSSNTRVKEKVTKDHYWYDHVNKEMLHLVGGRLSFAYDVNKKQMIPTVVDDEQYVYKNNYNDIESWAENNKNKMSFAITRKTGKNIFIDILAQNFDDITRDLYQNKIMFDYDPTEYYKEIKRWSR